MTPKLQMSAAGGPVPGKKNIGRLQIPVYESPAVGIGHAACDLNADIQYLFLGCQDIWLCLFAWLCMLICPRSFAWLCLFICPRSFATHCTFICHCLFICRCLFI